MTRFWLLNRLYRFRNEVLALWRAFWLPTTPLYLKAAMIGVVAYLLSPIDLNSDVIPILGLVDDVVLIPIIVSWIVSKLPQTAASSNGNARPNGGSGSAKTIDGTARRL